MTFVSSGGAAGAAGMMLLGPHSGSGPDISGAEFLIGMTIIIAIAAVVGYYVTHYDPPKWMG